ncbi:MAG TPA: zf-HC2 domain-containing protein, partial [Methylomirabilota bacterium]|nr:zf-HC2 domain-containing protein [Methylomirabilota bacterium]
MAQSKSSRTTACENIEQDLVLYYYGELESAPRGQVEVHIKDCAPCRLYLQEMASILPLTVKADEPPQTFWDNYSREMREKLATARERQSWWRSLASFFQPWAVP